LVPVDTNVQSARDESVHSVCPGSGEQTMARNIRRGDEYDSVLGSAEEPPLAAHLVTPRAFYTHHGIYVGNGRVVHYCGLERGWRRGPVEEVSLKRFACGRSVSVRNDPRRFGRNEVVARARSRLGELGYRLLTNNCEHFCAWALQGESRSRQVEGILAAPLILWRALRAACSAGGLSLARH
jgi:hypothetical protein